MNPLTETRERFLLAITAQVPADRIAEIHFFPPIKQGGIAAQQADVAAEHVAATLGAKVEPTAFRPVLRGELLTGEDSIKLLSVLVRNHARNRRRRHEVARPHDSGDEALALLTAEALPVDALIAQAQDFALMVGCLDHLGKLQRAVVSLRMLDEVALGKTGYRYHQILQELRDDPLNQETAFLTITLLMFFRFQMLGSTAWAQMNQLNIGFHPRTMQTIDFNLHSRSFAQTMGQYVGLRPLFSAAVGLGGEG